MRKNLLVGLSLALAAVVVVLASGWFDLELESVALLGIATGAVISVVPDRSPIMRLAALGCGVVLTLVAYVVRAAALPDTNGGRAVFAGLAVLLVTAVAVGSRGRLPLWAGLLGAAAFAGAYEASYAAAPPEVASTSLSSLTALVLTVAVGFVVATALSEARPEAARPHDMDRPEASENTHRLNDMMETQ